MNHSTPSDWMRGRAMAAVACASLTLPLVASASGAGLQTLPTTIAVTGLHQGMTTKKKVVLLVGAAALYYLYRRHQTKKADAAMAPQGQVIYYLSKNGRVYYRDANHQAHWVTPPTQPIAISPEEAQPYRGLQGYDRSNAGETNLSRFTARGGM